MKTTCQEQNFPSIELLKSLISTLKKKLRPSPISRMLKLVPTFKGRKIVDVVEKFVAENYKVENGHTSRISAVSLASLLLDFSIIIPKNKNFDCELNSIDGDHVFIISDEAFDVTRSLHFLNFSSSTHSVACNSLQSGDESQLDFFEFLLSEPHESLQTTPLLKSSKSSFKLGEVKLEENLLAKENFESI